MLYRPMPLDFSREILVFVHIPKTAGNSLKEVIVGHFGEEAYLYTYLEKIGKVHPTRLRKAIYAARKFVRNSALRLRGLDPLIRKADRNRDLNKVRLLTGHVTLGKEPKTGRNPVYISVVRDPTERFLSDYYYRFDIRASWPEGKKERHSFLLYDVDRFVDFVYDRRAWTPTNLQCRYIGGADNFEAARKAVDERLFLATPGQRINEFLELLRPALGFASATAPRANIGQARQERAAPSEKSIAKIREMVSEDQRLFDYISRNFDELYTHFGHAVQSA